VNTAGARLMVNMPPQHGKSELSTGWTPPWALELDPMRRILIATYGDEYASEWSGKVRDRLEGNEDKLRVRVRQDSRAANVWTTTAGGGVVGAGVGGRITGRGFDLIIIDDPVKDRAAAESKAERSRAWDWYTATLSTRLRPDASIVLVMTRWHKDDLAGRLLAEAEAGGDQWRVVSLPGLAEDGQEDPLGRAPGEALWPERYGAAYLEGTRRRIGAYNFAALYQGRPIPKGGGAFWNDDDLREARERAPRMPTTGELGADLVRVVVAVDPADSAEPGADETGIVVCGRERTGVAGILEDATGPMSPDQWGRRAVQAYLEHQADAIVYESNFGGKNTLALVIRTAAAALGVPTPKLVPVNAKRGKALRAEPVHQLYREARVWHLRTFPALEDELSTWKPDDKESPNRVDALVHGVTELLLQRAGTLRQS
jgi:hypothetical protein